MNLKSMLVSKICYVLLFVACLLIHVTLGQEDSLGSYLNHFCEGVGNSTTGSDFQYQENINRLLFKDFIDNGIATLFYHTTTGEHPKVYGLYSCRGDLSIADCKACVYQAGLEIFLQQCANGKNAMIWAEGCFIRYGNSSFFSKMIRVPDRVIWSKRSITVTGSFDIEMIKLFENLTEMATSNPPGLNFATTEVPFMENSRLYSLVQCTRDISTSDCKSCLGKGAISLMLSSKQAKEGGTYLCPSCTMKYVISEIPRNIAPSPTDDSSGINEATTRRSAETKRLYILKMVIGISISASFLLVVAVLYLINLRNRLILKDNGIASHKKKTMLRRGKDNENVPNGAVSESLELPLMSFDVISVATKQFADENKLAEGGFGPVYKGVLTNGEEIAVKRHVQTSGQGLQEYENEVSLVAKLQHRNLVRLLGCCLEEKELLLIYEYMPNKSLDTFLFDPERNKKLDWRMRFSVINGVARGMMYLHEDSRLKIIHRDLKASNVLLDNEMNPKISDFGMARIFYSNQKMENTNRIMGTYGYMAPEYALQGLFSEKSDVYSYGVLLLEIISGKKNTGFHLFAEGLGLVNTAWNLLSKSDTEGLELLDPYLKDSNSTKQSEVLKCIHIALLCVQDDPADRPTMSSVVHMLSNENTSTFQKPSQPTFTVQVYLRNKTGCTSEDLSTSVNEVSISTICPR